MTDALPPLPAQLPPLRSEHIVEVPTGSSLARLHDRSGPHPREASHLRWFGPLAGKGRFDHHPAGPPRDHRPEHGVLYVALDDPRVGPLADIEEDAGSVAGNVLDVLCAEAVQTGAILTITPALHLSVLTLRDPLRLLDLRGPWSQLTRVGTHLSTATHRSVQPWARAIRTTYPDLHGVLYVPATGGRAVAAALNESSSPMLATASLVASRPLGDLADLGILGDAAERVGIVLERVDRTG